MRGAWAALAGLALVAGGCATQNTARQYTELYQQRDFDGALKSASAAAKASEGLERERAALVAGMSAEAMNNYSEAEKWVRPLLTSTNSEVAGKANATMGIIAQDRGDMKKASLYYAAAADKLTGDDAARCALLAADASAATGGHGAAKNYYAMAATKALGADLKRQASGREQGPFAVQVGAFSSPAKAEAEAKRQRGPAKNIGQGVRIEPVIDAVGRTVYAVRIGAFGTREQATAAQGKLGAGQSVVVPARK
jgi:hypothetical protein